MLGLLALRKKHVQHCCGLGGSNFSLCRACAIEEEEAFAGGRRRQDSDVAGERSSRAAAATPRDALDGERAAVQLAASDRRAAGARHDALIYL